MQILIIYSHSNNKLRLGTYFTRAIVRVQTVRDKNTFTTCKFRLQVGQSNQPMNIARLIAMLQYSREQNIRFDCRPQKMQADADQFS